MKKRHVITGGIFLAVAATICLFIFGDFGLFRPDWKGFRYFQSGNFEEASRSFIDPMWRGAALYREGKFEESAGIYSGFDTAEAVYNHGNSLVMLGKYEDAVKRYQRALELKPGWDAAETNLRIARGRAEKLQKEGGEMTGGKLGADEIVFSDNTSDQKPDMQDDAGGQKMSDKELQAMWLRTVQTKPADFLRAKFSYQVAMQDDADVQREKQSMKNTNNKQ